MATTVVRERGKFAITCKVPMTHVPLWLKDGVPVAQSQGYHLQQDYSSNNGSVGHIFMRLSVERAHLSHAGHYKCSSFSPHAHRIVVVAGKAPHGLSQGLSQCLARHLPGSHLAIKYREPLLLFQIELTLRISSHMNLPHW